MENPSLTWPEKFRDYPNTRMLSMTDDVLRVLGA